MGQVVPFITRVRDSVGWTATERARLHELADQLQAGGVKVEVTFGATEEGDPWCVVTDLNGDVLIHVARIGGVVVVHTTVDDLVSRDGDLHAALRKRVAAVEDIPTSHSAEILPFGLTLRQGQNLLALLIATTFLQETVENGVAGSAKAASHPQLQDGPSPAPADDDTLAPERQSAVQGAALQFPEGPGVRGVVATSVATVVGELRSPDASSAGPVSDAAVTGPEPAAFVADSGPELAAMVVSGTNRDDELIGTSANERIQGGAGNDTLIGGGGHDTLEGGAGDDRIYVTSQVVAVGGAGADTFVIATPEQAGQADTLLGVIVDFNSLEGDRLLTADGDTVRLLPPRPPADDEGLAINLWGSQTTAGSGQGRTSDPASPVDTPPTQSPWIRVDVDLDGDGQADGYLLLQRHEGLPITLIASSLDVSDPFG